MSNMFYSCPELISANLSNLNTTKLTNMNCIFNNCTALTNLNISSMNTKNVEQMHLIFYDCKKLKIQICLTLIQKK